ncbi:mucin-21 isoform X2 [Oreochromis niloticus]|uniref:mucin-21 isoform X2 n=1 Tax=Oreochromis niloticus TaxID=8128 RepID=UPI000DF1FFE5|nr:mucin-21 isoform X2 [Oreochromis niloticus]
MAGHLLFVILMSFVHEIQAQELNSTSAHSEPSSITIKSQKPQMRVQHFNGEQVQFVCSLPGSVKDDTRCNLYFGEASRSVLTATVWKKSSTETKQRFCQFYVSIDDFLRHLHFVQQKEASCDYTLKREPRSLSPRSDQYNLTAILESESPKINKPSSIMTTAESSLSKPTTSSSTTSVNSPSGLTTILSAASDVDTRPKTAQYMTSGASTTAILESESPKINKPSSIMTTAESSLSKPTTSSSTTSVNSPSGLTTILSAASDVDTRPKTAQYMTSGASTTAILESESPKINKPSSIMTTAESSLSKPTTSSSTTSVNSPSGLAALNLSPTTGVNTPVKTTEYITSRDSTTESSLSSASASSPTTSVNSPSDSYKTNATTTITTVKVGQARQPDNKVNSSSKILQSAEASIWKLAVAVTGLGVTMGIILLVLGLLTFRRRSETCPQSRTKATSPGDFISMTKMNHGRMLPAGNDGGYSVITSVPDDNCLNREKLNLEQTKNEDSDIYHVYATISEETDPPDSQDMIYSMLNAH